MNPLFGTKILTPEQLEAEAAELSHYGGDAEYVDLYIGEDDDFLDFDGEIKNFAQEGALQKQFKVQVVNAATASRTAVIWPGYFKGDSTNAPGQLSDGAFNDTGGNAGLTGSSGISGKTIAEFFAFLEHNPTTVVQLKIASTVATQIDNDITVQMLNPFREERSQFLRASDYVNQQVYQDKTIVFPVELQLDNQVKLTYPFVASSTTSLIFYCGASLNLAQTLRKKRKRAKRNISAAGPSKVLGATLQKNAEMLNGAAPVNLRKKLKQLR